MVSPLKEKTGGTTGGMAQRGGVGRRLGLLTPPRCGGVAVARPFVDANGPFVMQMTLVPAGPGAHETGMKHDTARCWDIETASDGLRRQGCAVLRALGERRLARDFPGAPGRRRTAKPLPRCCLISCCGADCIDVFGQAVRAVVLGCAFVTCSPQSHGAIVMGVCQ
ncbi:hypothetical protein [Solidesulfovibrio sp.]|uniref:hypothetical protein n=1 Tax=Solidesulfovibrio sp. TaxID=2910990 RepID=UPI002B1EA822|nr:hypothetical protein [Solidesulfovibrio sp.]MEA5089674.1 hypothetical protein [Solidesulfovibrio sp.]